MRPSLVAIGAAVAATTLSLLTQAAGAAPQKYTWDGLGNGQGNCGIYRMHIEVTVDNGRAVGTFQQKGRPQRNFDLPVIDGKFTGDAKVEGGTMRVVGNVSGSPEIKLSGYCGFGGPLKAA
jgi:hypothetical protein